MTCEGLGGRLGDPGEWEQLDRYLIAYGVPIGPPCLVQTTGGTHATTSNHYRRLARDYSAGMGADELAVVRMLKPLYYLGYLSELYHAATRTWLPSNVGGHTDHVHAALKAGARLPIPEPEEDYNMGALNGDAIRPGESIPFRILPPGGGAVGPLRDPVYISIPFDTLGGEAGKVRWAIVNDKGDVIESNDVDRPGQPKHTVPNTGVRLQAHGGAYMLTVENKEPAGGRIVGPPCFEWSYAKPAAAASLAERDGADGDGG